MKRLLLDLEKCSLCKDKKCECSYPYHSANKGIDALIEFATFIYICRHCDEAPCVNACPKEALEKTSETVLKRYNNRCISCKSCMIACPFGTIVPDVVPYLSLRCDLCIGRTIDANEPVCVGSCPYGALSFSEVEPSQDKNIYIVNDNLAVHCVPWRKPEMKKQ